MLCSVLERVSTFPLPSSGKKYIREAFKCLSFTCQFSNLLIAHQLLIQFHSHWVISLIIISTLFAPTAETVTHFWLGSFCPSVSTFFISSRPGLVILSHICIPTKGTRDTKYERESLSFLFSCFRLLPSRYSLPSSFHRICSSV